jgi:putative flippase GtrA
MDSCIEGGLMSDVRLTPRETRIQILKFTLFSISAGVIQVIAFTLMNELAELPYWPSYLTALVLSVLWNFTFNKKFTFHSAANVPVAMFKVAVFYAVFTPLSTWGGDALDSIGWNRYLILALTMIMNLVTEYLYTRYYVYRHSINTDQPK